MRTLNVMFYIEPRYRRPVKGDRSCHAILIWSWLHELSYHEHNAFVNSDNQFWIKGVGASKASPTPCTNNFPKNVMTAIEVNYEGCVAKMFEFTCRGVLVLPALWMNGTTSKNRRSIVVSHMHIGHYTQDHPSLVWNMHIVYLNDTLLNLIRIRT